MTRLGDPEGPTVVVVHGTMDRSGAFRRAARRARDLDIVLFDRRGYGESREAGLSPTVEAQVADLLAVAAWAGDDPVTMVGHSLGGVLAVHAALTEPDRVRSLGLWEPPMPWLPWYASAAGERARALGRMDDSGQAAELFLRAMVGDRIWDRMPAVMREERRAEGGALLADLDLVRRPAAAFDPAELRLPTLLGCGSESSERFRRSATTLNDAVAGSWLLEVAGAQHGVHLSHPDEFAGFLRAAAALGPAS